MTSLKARSSTMNMTSVLVRLHRALIALVISGDAGFGHYSRRADASRWMSAQASCRVHKLCRKSHWFVQRGLQERCLARGRAIAYN
jgi:hypothetical protein